MGKAKYIGYIWYSDAMEPVVFNGDESVDIRLDANETPFIVEGQLYCAETSESMSIRYVDGKYLTRSFTVTDDDLRTAVCYEANRMNGRFLKFSQRWMTKEDELCEGMQVMVPGEMVFVGFEK